MQRRTMLAAVASTASTAALAGCSDILGDSNGESSVGPLVDDAVRAPYDRYNVADVHQEVDSRDVPAHAGITIDVTADPGPRVDASLPVSEDDADPLVALGTSTVGVSLFSVGLKASRTGLARVVEEGSGLERIHMGTIPVLAGDFDEDRIASDLETAGFRRSEPYRDLEVYQAANSPDLLAFDGERIFIGTLVESSVEGDADGAGSRPGLPVRRITEATVDAASGDRQRASETLELYDDLVTALPERQCMTAIYRADGGLFQRTGDEEENDGSIEVGPDPREIDLEGDAVGYATAFDMPAPGTETTYYLAIRYADADEVDDESAIHQAVAPGATDPDVAVGGPLAVVSGTYERQSED